MLLGIGLTTGIIVQALFNISVVISILPAKGIPLPFISYGGSSVIVTLVAVGILLNISQRAGAGASARCRTRLYIGRRRRVRKPGLGNGDSYRLKPVPNMRVLIAAGVRAGTFILASPWRKR
jgi:hypothetical protein